MSMEQMANENNRYVWTYEEVQLFLALIEEKNITATLDGKQQRNSTIYQHLIESTLSKGYDKPWNVLMSKWKALRQRYMCEKRQMSRSGAGGKTKFFFITKIDNILGQRPIVTSLASIINSTGWYQFIKYN